MHVRVYMFSLIKEGQTYILGTFFLFLFNCDMILLQQNK